MTDFGFKKERDTEPKGKGIDLSGIPSGALPVDPALERDAIKRGEVLGFTDRGQAGAERGRGGRRKRPAPVPQRPIYIRAPEELADWFEACTEERGHKALWQSIQDFRDMLERNATVAASGEPGA